MGLMRGVAVLLLCSLIACSAQEASEDRFAEAKDEATVVIQAGVTSQTAVEDAEGHTIQAAASSKPKTDPKAPAKAEASSAKSETSLSVGGQKVSGIAPPEKKPDTVATMADIQNLVNSPLQKELLVQEMKKQDAEVQRQIADEKREVVAVQRQAEEEKLKAFAKKERQERTKKYDLTMHERREKDKARRTKRREREDKRRRRIQRNESRQKTRELRRKRRRRNRRIREHKLEMHRKSYRAHEFRKKTLERTVKAAASSRSYNLKLAKEKFSKKKGLENESKRRKFQLKLVQEQDRKSARYNQRFMHQQMSEKQRKMAPLKEESHKARLQAKADLEYEKRLAKEEIGKRKIMHTLVKRQKAERKAKQRRRLALKAKLSEEGGKESAQKASMAHGPRAIALQKAAAALADQTKHEEAAKAALVKKLRMKGKQEKARKLAHMQKMKVASAAAQKRRALSVAAASAKYQKSLANLDPTVSITFPKSTQKGAKARLKSQLQHSKAILAKTIALNKVEASHFNNKKHRYKKAYDGKYQKLSWGKKQKAKLKKRLAKLKRHKHKSNATSKWRERRSKRLRARKLRRKRHVAAEKKWKHSKRYKRFLKKHRANRLAIHKAYVSLGYKIKGMIRVARRMQRYSRSRAKYYLKKASAFLHRAKLQYKLRKNKSTGVRKSALANIKREIALCNRLFRTETKELRSRKVVALRRSNRHSSSRRRRSRVLSRRRRTLSRRRRTLSRRRRTLSRRRRTLSRRRRHSKHKLLRRRRKYKLSIRRRR